MNGADLVTVLVARFRSFTPLIMLIIVVGEACSLLTVRRGELPFALICGLIRSPAVLAVFVLKVGLCLLPAISA